MGGHEGDLAEFALLVCAGCLRACSLQDLECRNHQDPSESAPFQGSAAIRESRQIVSVLSGGLRRPAPSCGNRVFCRPRFRWCIFPHAGALCARAEAERSGSGRIGADSEGREGEAMSLLLELTLRGSAAVLGIFVLDRSLAGRICASSRRLWCCILPLAFLVPWRIPMLSALGRLPPVIEFLDQPQIEIPAGAQAAATNGMNRTTLGLGIWLAGALAYVVIVVIQTRRACRRWSRERLSTDHPLLELLEDCKAEADVTAPIGLVVSNSVSSPAIMGWLRPRILLPESLAAAAPALVLRPIFLHELAHFRCYDVPFNWLLTLVRAIHWFNPLAHLGAVSWTHFREEAADEAAVKWMRNDSAMVYGDALVHSLRHCRGASAPFGSIAIVESVQQLKKRIFMI